MACVAVAGQQPLLVRGIDPGAGDNARAIARTDFVLVEVDGGVNVGRVHHPLLDEQRLERFHAKRDVRRRDLRCLPWLVSVCGTLRDRCRGREGRGT